MWDSLILYSLATWRLSYLLVHERGPWDMMVRIRKRLGVQHNEEGTPLAYPDTFFGNLFSCVFCMSVWVAVLFVVLDVTLSSSVINLVAMPFSISAISVIIDTVMEKY